MRPLTDSETKTFFEKLAVYIGKNIKMLIDRPADPHVFRLHKDRVYYVSEKTMKLATNMARDKLVTLGTCFGKFTKSRKCRIHITALAYLAQFAQYKVWVKPGAEMSFLYGNHVTKQGLARMTEATPKHAGLVVFNMNNIPLGFGIAAQTTEYTHSLEATANVVLHQADIGEYLRIEDTMTIAS